MKVIRMLSLSLVCLGLAIFASSRVAKADGIASCLADCGPEPEQSCTSDCIDTSIATCQCVDDCLDQDYDGCDDYSSGYCCWEVQ